jgi:predicted alpha/beta hydrolase
VTVPPQPAAPERLEVALPAGDRLAVDYLSGPDGAPVAVVLPALGVPARVYRRFAAALNARALGVAVVDLRGTGDSVPRVDASARHGYHELATVDLPAILNALRRQAPASPLVIVGHSLGGQLAPMYAARFPEELAGLVFVAAGTPHFRAYRGLGGLTPLLGTSAVAGIARVRGYWPGDRLRFAGRQSRVLVADWARLARTGRYRMSGADVDYERLMAQLDLPVLAISVGGDRLAPPTAVDALLGLLPRVRVTRHHHGGSSGHVGWLADSALIADLIAGWVTGLVQAPGSAQAPGTAPDPSPPSHAEQGK